MPASNNSKQPHGHELHLYRQDMDSFFNGYCGLLWCCGIKNADSRYSVAPI
ncbi:MAG: hypothetical protein AAF349_02655 [Cyanobacteria bacterium P01_A01_bin.68]